MVVSPVLRGMFGLQTEAIAGMLTFAPHAPADWASFSIRNVQVGAAKLDLYYSKDLNAIALKVKVAGGMPRTIEFQPAVSLRAKILGVDFNGKPIPFRVQTNSNDQHVIIKFTANGGSNILRIKMADDFGLRYDGMLPALGAISSGLRILSETWTPAHDHLIIQVSGVAGGHYELSVSNPDQIASVTGATLKKDVDGKTKLIIEFPKPAGQNILQTAEAAVSIQFRQPTKNGRNEIGTTQN
jgi:hypothetical protein